MTRVTEEALFQRAALLAGPAGMRRFARCRVIVFGLGGVGSWCAEALARTGFKHLTLVDSDTICVTNVNRQAQATALNVGAVKAEALRQRLLEINPHAAIEARRVAYDAGTCDQFDLGRYDFVVDAIDSLKNKVLLIEQCVRASVKFWSSMGAAARMDPMQIRTGTLDQTRGCPLARAVRQELRRRRVPLEAVRCVYSVEPALEPVGATECGLSACLCQPDAALGSDLRAGAKLEVGARSSAGAGMEKADFPDWCAGKARINGAFVHVTAVFGFTLAGLIIRDCLQAGQPGEKGAH